MEKNLWIIIGFNEKKNYLFHFEKNLALKVMLISFFAEFQLFFFNNPLKNQYYFSNNHSLLEKLHNPLKQ